MNREFWIEIFNETSPIANNRLLRAYDKEQRELEKEHDPDFDKRNVIHVIEKSTYDQIKYDLKKEQDTVDYLLLEIERLREFELMYRDLCK